MDYAIIQHLEPLVGCKGYVGMKPEGTAYPGFVVEATQGRGTSLYDNQGKPFDYIHEIQINLIGQKYSALRPMRETVINELDGFTGNLGSFDVVDCRLQESAVLRSVNKNYECVLTFTLNTK